MNINVTGKGMSVGEALTTKITENLDEHLKRYFERSMDAHVVVAKEHSAFAVDITAHVPGEVMKASAEADDAYAAYDAASTKLFAQVRKHKSKMTDHHRDAVPGKSISA